MKDIVWFLTICAPFGDHVAHVNDKQSEDEALRAGEPRPDVINNVTWSMDLGEREQHDIQDRRALKLG